MLSLAKSAEFCIVVSGLPASGKTSVGKTIAKILDIAFLDKDDFLEELFHTQGTGDRDHRQYLSRISDEQYQAQAQTLQQAVLISNLRPDSYSLNSGTLTNWVPKAYRNVIELYCYCPANVAAKRFRLRNRHPGHLDKQKSATQTLQWMQSYQDYLPLNLGSLVKVDTTNEVDYDKLIRLIRGSLDLS